jgi:hypothetical protein
MAETEKFQEQVNQLCEQLTFHGSKRLISFSASAFSFCWFSGVNSPSASRSRHSKQALAKNSLFSPEVLNLFNRLTATITHRRENVQYTTPENGLTNKINYQRELDLYCNTVNMNLSYNTTYKQCSMISQNKF